MNIANDNITTLDLYKLILEVREEFRKEHNDIKSILNNLNINKKDEKEIFNNVDKDIDSNKIKKYLCNNSVLSDISLIKNIYLSNSDKTKNSIKFDKYFYYWDNEWIKNDNYLFTKLFNTLKQKYLSVNTFNNFKDNVPLMMKNQTHIYKIGKKSYLIEFKNKLKEIM